MSDKPFLVTLEHVKEHENGDATYTFDMTETARDAILEEGLKLMLYCGVAKVDLQDVYDWILAQADKPKQETPDTIWVDFNEEGSVVAGGAGPARYDGEHTYVKKQEAKLREGRHPLSDDWFREKAAAFTFDEYGYYGENNGPLPPTEDIRPMTDEERQRAKEREEANKCSP